MVAQSEREPSVNQFILTVFVGLFFPLGGGMLNAPPVIVVI